MTKLVCRLLDVDGTLLGWCEHTAAIRGDGFLRASSPVSIVMDVHGAPHELSIHWADVNVETRVPFPSRYWHKAGTPLTVFTANQPMIQAGRPPAQRLPPVTTKSPVLANVPVGQLGATGVLA